MFVPPEPGFPPPPELGGFAGVGLGMFVPGIQFEHPYGLPGIFT